jgi:hypothetical protein
MKKTLTEFLIETYSFEYHEKLHSKIWNEDNTLKENIRDHLRKIAKKYFEYLSVSPDYHIIDIIFTGSLANYNYTKYSDIDLHVVIDKSPDYCDECGLDLEDVLKTKKDLWSKQHDIHVYGYPVELYAQLQDEELHSAGIYSVVDDKWVQKPKYITDLAQDVDNYAINVKSSALKRQIDELINEGDLEAIKRIKKKIKNMRQSGLAKGGEYSIENLVFKDLRNSGYLDKLQDIKDDIEDEKMSLN